MIKVKCFKFEVEYKVKKSHIQDYFLDEQYLDLKLTDEQVVTPYVKLTPNQSDIPKFDLIDMIDGYIVEHFNVISCAVSEFEDHLIINSIFTLEFDQNSTITLRDNIITMQQDDGNYEYCITPSFSSADSPSLTKPSLLDIKNSSMKTNESIEKMTM
ncbi:TPA: hypothetical protein GRI77_00645 [Vibrio parahaemolyticus]|uniref:hypothetical protein n=1 Tax=Vibrio parahaemolyticus TaxID=670 RepID=UPI0007A00DC6|nr:hypothetical protein [Vibrio parahaemolyticus]EGQ9512900.1 hypothetical protein [Vibrio parahaemolyticus]EHW0694940.1 hypothetical protein [Vibrio parahaemolyticus]EIT7140803.1 hypothetical protein [Vibrio parahaemolyticus]EIU6803026.1 hypothetical protein [Vibrio parahaemolyticus]EJC7015353.1 hypothetical protein [Vibrio parahaemolyticus]